MPRTIDVIIILCLYFAAYASLALESLNAAALYFALPVAFLLRLVKNRDVGINKFLNKYEVVLLLLFAWVFLSSLWAQYEASASRELHRCLGSILLSFIFAANATDKKMRPWLYLTYLVLYMGAWNYAQNNIVIDVTGAYGSDRDRMNDAKLNANTMAYYTFFVSFVIFILGEWLENDFWRKICKIAFFMLFPLSFVVALVTASRQVLIIQVPLLTFMLYYRYWQNMSGLYRAISIIVIVAVFVALSGFVESVYSNSYLAVRSEKNLNDDSRFLLLEDAAAVAIDHFPLGVGAGNYIEYSYNRHFSHSSYFELFANQGIVGLFLFVYLIGLFVKNQWNRFMITQNRNYLLFFVFGLIFLIDNIFYVFYLDMWLIGFFILVATHSLAYSQEHYGSCLFKES